MHCVVLSKYCKAAFNNNKNAPKQILSSLIVKLDISVELTDTDRDKLK